ncbi:MAG: hypothetical protein MJ089_07640 [Ruminococcus sp.]|nr:hypothetical protein [Ruminococcus sp.]
MYKIKPYYKDLYKVNISEKAKTNNSILKFYISDSISKNISLKMADVSESLISSIMHIIIDK